jgi:aerobic carbon-monoxide dehydrogenase medium subunit
VIPAGFDYRRAGSVAEAVGLLSEYGADAKLLAGGHSLLPLMKLRLAVPSLLIDVGRLSELAYVHDEGGYIAVGALTRHRDLELSGVLQREAPVVSYVASQVGDPQVRHRGTIGGSLAHGDPASDLPAVVLALGGALVVEGPGGRREISAGDFFLGFLETAIGPDEMLTEIRLPKAPGGWSFQKFNRRAQDWATVGVVAVAGDGRGPFDSGAGDGTGPVRVALVNMGLTPLRAGAVERAVAAGAGAAQAAALAGEGTEPPTDLNASAEFRRHLASVLVRRALEEALAGADGEQAGR